MDTSCKVAELPQRPLRRVAVSLSQNETILLRVLPRGRCPPADILPSKYPYATSSRLKKNCQKRRVPASCVRCATAQIIAKHARRTGQPASVTVAADGHATRTTNRGPARAALMASQH